MRRLPGHAARAVLADSPKRLLVFRVPHVDVIVCREVVDPPQRLVVRRARHLPRPRHGAQAIDRGLIADALADHDVAIVRVDASLTAVQRLSKHEQRIAQVRQPFTMTAHRGGERVGGLRRGLELFARYGKRAGRGRVFQLQLLAQSPQQAQLVVGLGFEVESMKLRQCELRIDGG